MTIKNNLEANLEILAEAGFTNIDTWNKHDSDFAEILTDDTAATKAKIVALGFMPDSITEEDGYVMVEIYCGLFDEDELDVV